MSTNKNARGTVMVDKRQHCWAGSLFLFSPELGTNWWSKCHLKGKCLTHSQWSWLLAASVPGILHLQEATKHACEEQASVHVRSEHCACHRQALSATWRTTSLPTSHDRQAFLLGSKQPAVLHIVEVKVPRQKSNLKIEKLKILNFG